MCNDNKNMNEEELKKVNGGEAQEANCRPDRSLSSTNSNFNDSSSDHEFKFGDWEDYK